MRLLNIESSPRGLSLSNMSSVQARRQHKALAAVHRAAIIGFIASFADQALRVELMLNP
jgi:hypothetical protein